MRRLICIVSQSCAEEWQRLNDEDVKALKRQIRKELQEPDAGVVVLPPGCSIDIGHSSDDDEEVTTGCPACPACEQESPGKEQTEQPESGGADAGQ